MNQKELLKKITHNKVLLFIVPNLIYMIRFLYTYNCNFNLDHMNESLFSEVILASVIFFIITLIFYLIIKIFIKDRQKIFCILCFICCFYFTKFGLIDFLCFILFIFILIFDFKKIIKFQLDNVVYVICFMVVFLFGYHFVIGCYHLGYSLMISKSYSNDKEVIVDDSKESPNIYWIHCDAMMSMDSMSEYFHYYDGYLEKYLEDNNYFINNGASMVVGHHTSTALVALFNPSYYDLFFKDYLNDLEDDFIENSVRPSSIVGYEKLKDKRFNNEVFNALEEKGYVTYAVSQFDQYSSLSVDYYYDYFYGLAFNHFDDGKDEFREIKNNNHFRLSLMSDFTHLRSLLDNTMLYELVKNINFLDYDIVDYKSFDSSDYEFIDKTDYWVAKAILKGLDMSMESDNNKFVFVDYNLAHLPLVYDIYGNKIDINNEYNLNYYLGNYIYSSYLLVDMLEFIKNNDDNAIIVVQGDHGIHMLEDEYLMEYFNVDMEGVMDIRNSVISAIYIPDKYKNGDEEYLTNPLNISRYLINNYVGENYDYIK